MREVPVAVLDYVVRQGSPETLNPTIYCTRQQEPVDFHVLYKLHHESKF